MSTETFFGNIRITPNRREVLINLYGESPKGIAPMWFGGSNGSHHASTATALCKTDPPLVERRYRGNDWGAKHRWVRERGSCVYRLTEAGERCTESIVNPKHVEGMRRRKAEKLAAEAAHA